MTEHPADPRDEAREQAVNLLGLRGRIGSRHFRRGLLICAVLSAFIAPFSSVPMASVPIFAFVAWIFLAICIKRLHDFGWSGWWLSPLIPAAIYMAMEGGGAGMFVLFPWFLALAGVLILLVVFSLKNGTAGPNRYGSDPMANDPLMPY